MKLPLIFQKRKNKQPFSLIFSIIYFLMMIFIIVAIIGLIVVTFIYNHIKDDLSANIQKGYDIVSTISDKDFNSRYSTILYDKDGNVLKVFNTVEYLYAEYEDMNPNVFNALIAIEDERYYQHNGFDLKGFVRAIYSTVILHNTQGGSTITQQLVKNIYLTNEVTVWRKVTEAVIAQELEKLYSKEDILEFYVNNVNYANGCYSIESAANYYFQKSTKDLTIAEIALLTGIPNNPTKYNPLKNMENALDRKDTILYKMYEVGMLSKSEYEIEKNREIILNKKTVILNNDVEDYAQSYAIHKAVEQIMKINGFQFIYDFNSEEERELYWDLYTKEYGDARSELISGGYEIYTCIDMELQKQLQDIVNERMKSYKTIDETNGLYEKQASATVIDNSNGMVIAMVGGRTDENMSNTFNRAYLSARQPGSAIKPLIVYTPIFEKGYLPSDQMLDEPIPNGPKNAGGASYGIVSLRFAVEKSINTIAYNLCKIITPKVGINKLSNMNFRYLDSSDKEYPIVAVGGFKYGTNTLEMSSAYSTLARNGKYIEPTNIYKIVKINTGKIIYQNDFNEKQIYDEGASYIMTDVLKGVIIRGTGTRYGSKYKYQAGKTGTTNESKDVWFCGMTPYYSMAVWVGNDTPKKQSSMTAQGYIWKDMMNYLHQDLEVIDFVKPETVKLKDDGELYYLITQKTNVKNERFEKEKNRKTIELNKLLQGYNFNNSNISEEEILKQMQARKLLDELRSFKLQSISQIDKYYELKNLTFEAIQDIKQENISSEYYKEYNIYINTLNETEYILKQNDIKSEEEIWNEVWTEEE